MFVRKFPNGYKVWLAIVGLEKSKQDTPLHIMQLKY